MTVTVTDRRSVLAQAESSSETEDAGAGAWNAGATHSASYAEAANCIAIAYNETTGQLYFELTTATIDVSDTLIYIQTSVVATQLSWNTTSDPQHALFLTDGTNDVAFAYSGSDRRQFSHDKDGPVSWQCFVLDGSQASQKNTDGEAYALAGSIASLLTNLNSITGAGVHFSTQSKALGGGVNCYVDIIRYGNDGIRITAGGSATQGTFTEIVAEDKATTNGKAHGIIREYTAGIYGCQGPLTFGDSGSATTCYFEDTGIVLAFEDRDIGNDKYYVAVEGNASATNSFVLNGSTITTAGPFVTCTFNGGNIDTLTIENCVFVGLGNSITFSNGADATGHSISGCTFDGCGQIDPGDVTFENNTLQNTTASTTGALLIDADGTSNIQNLSFVSGGSGHAIYIPPGATGTYTFTNFTYNGYGSTGTTDAVIYNNSGGSVTINVSGGDTPTYRNGSGASTTIVSSVTLTVSVKDVDGDPIQNAQTAIYKVSDDTQLMNEDTTSGGVATESYGGATPVDVIVRVRKSSSIDSPKYVPVESPQTISSSGLTVTITLQEDTNNNA